MKQFYFLFCSAFLLMACSKDKFDPSDPKNGQEVELFLDHYTTGGSSRIFLNTDKKEAFYSYVDNFSEREMGYTYIIKARVVRPKEPLQDGPSYWFNYEKTIRQDKYQGLDTFALPLFGAAGPFSYFCLRKEADKYYYNGAPLTAFDNQVKADFDAVLEQGPPLLNTSSPSRTTMTLRVQHDPNNYSKGYLVYKVTF
jgi:archaellin